MSIIRAAHNENFVVMNKICLQDKKLSWKAKGIYSYLMSLPTNWEIKTSEVKNHSADGRTALLSGIKELIEHGYCDRIENRDENGKITTYDYIIKETPQIILNKEELPRSGFPLADNLLTENQPLLNNNISNKEFIKNTTQSKKTVNKKKKVKKFNQNSIGGKLAQYLLDKIEENDPTFPTPELGKWEGCFNKMVFVDGKPSEEIENIIKYAQESNYWKSFILDPYKLNAKYQTLKMQMNNPMPYSQNLNNKKNNKDVFEEAKEKGIDKFTE